MHISPESSLARSGFSSTVIEKSIGQMFANPSPAATTPANVRVAIRPSSRARPASPARPIGGNKCGLHDHQQCAAQETTDGQDQEEQNGRQIIAEVSTRPNCTKAGVRNRPIEASAPTYRKIPNTANKKTGSCNKPRLDRMPGGSSALVSLTFSKATLRKARTMRPQNKGNPAFQSRHEQGIAAMVGSRWSPPSCRCP